MLITERCVTLLFSGLSKPAEARENERQRRARKVSFCCMRDAEKIECLANVLYTSVSEIDTQIINCVTVGVGTIGFGFN